jgi:nicotinamide-nucleotide amidase
MKAIIITIGDEILIGQVLDTNSAWLAEQLQLMNVEVVRMSSISDEHNDIVKTLSEGLSDADLILITGGLGPTKDDITKKSLTEYFETELVFDQEVYLRIEKLLAKFGRKPTEAHRDQAYMPLGVLKLHNELGTAPGMLFKKEEKMVLSMPGVPYEMKYIFHNSFKPILEEKLNHKSIYHRTIQTAGMGESVIAERIEMVTDALPSYVKIAFLPSLGKVRLRLSGSHEDGKQLKTSIDNALNAIVEKIPELVFGFDNDSLESVLMDKCIAKGLSFGTAESCTGGNISARLTKISGSSAYYQGSIISYSNKIKEKQLGVSADTLKRFGAVSKETVLEMAKGACVRLGVDCAVAVSGIAGPGGATKDKPVGTIHIACSNGKHHMHRLLSLSKTRSLNIEYTTNMAILLALKFLEKHY